MSKALISSIELTKLNSHFFALINSNIYVACQNERNFRNKSEKMQIYANSNKKFEIVNLSDLLNKEIEFESRFDEVRKIHVFVHNVKIRDRLVVNVDLKATKKK